MKIKVNLCDKKLMKSSTVRQWVKYFNCTVNTSDFLRRLEKRFKKEHLNIMMYGQSPITTAFKDMALKNLVTPNVKWFSLKKHKGKNRK